MGSAGRTPLTCWTTAAEPAMIKVLGVVVLKGRTISYIVCVMELGGRRGGGGEHLDKCCRACNAKSECCFHQEHTIWYTVGGVGVTGMEGWDEITVGQLLWSLQC